MSRTKLGNNPFKGGVDSLIRDTQNTQHVHDVQSTPDTQEVQHVHSTQGKKGQKLPRINMAFQPETLEYLQIMSGFENISITQMVNQLICEDMKKKSDLYSQILELKMNNAKP